MLARVRISRTVLAAAMDGYSKHRLYGVGIGAVVGGGEGELALELELELEVAVGGGLVVTELTVEECEDALYC